MFRVLSDIHLGPGSVRIIPITQNTKKQDPFGIYVGFGSVRIHFYRIGFGSDFRVRFICPALLPYKWTIFISLNLTILNSTFFFQFIRTHPIFKGTMSLTFKKKLCLCFLISLSYHISKTKVINAYVPSENR